MKKLVIVVSGLLLFETFAISQATKGKNSAVEQKLTSSEKQLWEGWKNKDFSSFKQDLSDDSIMIDQSGMAQGKDKALDGLSKNPCDVKSYSLGDIKVDWLDKDTALLTYKADVDATCGGQKVPPSVYASSVWEKKGAKWMAAFHQETAVSQSSGQ